MYAMVLLIWLCEVERPAGTLIHFTIESDKRMAGSGAGDKLGLDGS